MNRVFYYFVAILYFCALKKILKFMKTKILLLILCGIFNFSYLFANQELYKTANDYYSKGQYSKAVEEYEKILNSGNEAAEIYYNLGNAHYKMGNFAYAILNYERSLLLNPSDEATQFNLKLAQQKTTDKIEVLPEFFLSVWVKNLIKSQSTDNWAALSISMFIVTLLCGLIFVFLNNSSVKKIAFFTGIFVFLVSLSAFIFANKQHNSLTNRNSAIITSPSAVVKSAPEDKSTELFIIHEGTKVFIENQNGFWYEIKLADGKVGWLKRETVTKI